MWLERELRGQLLLDREQIAIVVPQSPVPVVVARRDAVVAFTIMSSQELQATARQAEPERNRLGRAAGPAPTGARLILELNGAGATIDALIDPETLRAALSTAAVSGAE